MRIIVCPAPSYRNPFLALFGTHLEEVGARVTYVKKTHSLLMKLLQTRRPDVLNLHWLEFFTGRSTVRAALACCFLLVCLGIAKVRGVRIYWTVHNIKPHNSRNRCIEYVCRYVVSRFSDGIVAMSPSARVCIDQNFALPFPKVSVIAHPNFIRRYGMPKCRKVARSRLGVPQDAFVLGFCGSLREYKGVDLLLDAFRGLKDRNITLVIAGEIQSLHISQSILKEIQQKDDKKIVYLPHFLSDEELVSCYAAFDLTVLPYKNILNSGSAICSLSLGVPVIIPEAQELSDLAKFPGVWTFKKGDVGSLRNTIEDFISSPTDPAVQRKQVLSTAQAFDPRSIALHYYRLFEKGDLQYFYPVSHGNHQSSHSGSL